jgi:2-polyprenyl-6-methoxyphenol hydroxylase-like FAD-dependent oxidoreductase
MIDAAPFQSIHVAGGTGGERLDGGNRCAIRWGQPQRERAGDRRQVPGVAHADDDPSDARLIEDPSHRSGVEANAVSRGNVTQYLEEALEQRPASELFDDQAIEEAPRLTSLVQDVERA